MGQNLSCHGSRAPIFHHWLSSGDGGVTWCTVVNMPNGKACCAFSPFPLPPFLFPLLFYYYYYYYCFYYYYFLVVHFPPLSAPSLLLPPPLLPPPPEGVLSPPYCTTWLWQRSGTSGQLAGVATNAGAPCQTPRGRIWGFCRRMAGCFYTLKTGASTACLFSSWVTYAFHSVCATPGRQLGVGDGWC